MRDVLAVLERGGDDNLIVVAGALATLLGATARAFRAPDGEPQTRIDAVMTELGGDVVAAVLSAQVPEPLCWEVMQRARIPLLVVPKHAELVREQITTVLLPLDGAPETAESVAPLAARFADAHSRVLIVHVFDEATVPAFWDQAAHSQKHWADEFLLRNLPSADDLRLRRGHTPEEVVIEAQRAGADLIVIGWGQDLGAGRARTVRGALLTGSVPVLLVPTKTGPPRPGKGPSTLDSVSTKR